MARILIVDDDRDSAEALTRFLARSGHQVESKTNGHEALDQIIHHTPDLLILDLLMPELDGTGLLGIIRSYLRLRKLPVIVLTALSTSPLIERAKRLNVTTVLTKLQSTPDQVLAAANDELKRAATQND
jgi:CheY-like chemotaxis protein